MGQTQVDCLITALEASPLAISEPFLKRCCPSKLRPQSPRGFVTIAAFIFAAALLTQRQQHTCLCEAHLAMLHIHCNDCFSLTELTSVTASSLDEVPINAIVYRPATSELT